VIRKEIYTIAEVLSKRVPSETKKKKSLTDFDGDLMKMNSQRLELFDLKGVKCVCCGIKGSFFAKEKHPLDQRYHFNLYAIDNAGNEVLMTKDHIVPKSLSGANHISNYQTMCQPCNRNKGSKVIIYENKQVV